ncbi:hypothetical protein GCM10011578_002790 [Streptomyces fuscichromogenes]|uniref:Uncharacterized protein n=1 Tax=Streptomyces fuscichromogenes TaxID=1324013 RepID=A0A917UG95_9ACTN|nr:hypothetical protein GCM10011578_002790 [Streptomyces fuscichromogenes]
MIGAQSGPGAGARAAAVEAAGPGRAGAGQPDRADEGDQRDDHPEDRGTGLALAQRDEGEAEVGDDVRDDGPPALEFVRREVVDAERREPGEQQPHQRGRDDDGLDALAALLGPVDVAEVQDQRELVEHEPRADPEHDRGEASAEAVTGTGDRAEAADDDEDDPGDHVVDVQPARLHVPERALPGADQPGDDPGDHEGQDEGGQGQQQRKFARLDNVPLQPMSHVRTLSLAGSPADDRTGIRPAVGRGSVREAGGGRVVVRVGGGCF